MDKTMINSSKRHSTIPCLIGQLGYKDEKQYQKGAIEFWKNKNAKPYLNEKL